MHAPIPKIACGRQWRPFHHRSGWGYAMDALACLHNERGVVLEGFIEKKFAWGGDAGDRNNGHTPYATPWIGFIHNPPNIPSWFNWNRQAPADIFATPAWQQSLPLCLGLFTLSTYLKDWVERRVPVRVCSLALPSEAPSVRFTAGAYRANDRKQLVQVGWWLRRFASFYELPVRRLHKVLLSLREPWTEEMRRVELGSVVDAGAVQSVQVVPYIGNEEYDALLSRNVVFLDLYDSSANNAIVECIVRATPLVVNRLPAVVEYLGPDYPLYFTTLDEAAAIAEDDDLVIAAHDYLAAHPRRDCYTRTHFLQSFVDSEIYRSLPHPGEAIDCSCFAATPDAELPHDWRNALSGDADARAQFHAVEGGSWSWGSDGLRARAGRDEWSVALYTRADSRLLQSLGSFVIEVTVSGRARAAGISFGAYKDFLVEMTHDARPRRLRLHVDPAVDRWTLFVDGRQAARCWWEGGVHTTRDIVDGCLAFKVRGADDVLFQDFVLRAGRASD